MPIVATDPSRYGLDPAAREIIAVRSAHVKHFLLDGSRRIAVLQRNLHYQDGSGDWDDVDLSFVAEDADHVVRRHLVNSRISGTWPGMELWERATGKGIRFLTPGRPEVVAAQKARFGKDGLTWTHSTRRSGVKLEALVTARQGQVTYKFPYQLLGGATSLTLDAGGNLVSDAFSLPMPFAIGADGQVYLCAQWELGPGNQVVLVLDDRVLPDAAFPYVLDPSTTFTVAASGDDAHTRANSATYPPAYADVDTVNVNIWVIKDKDGATYRIWCGHLRWDTTLPGASITAASLRVRVVGINDNDSRNLVADWNQSTWPLGSGDHAENVGTDALDKDLSDAGLAAGAYRTIVLSSPSSVNVSGYTSLRLGISGGAPASLNRWYFASYDNTSSYDPPQLIVEYTAPVIVMLSGTSTTETAGQGAAVLVSALSGVSTTETAGAGTAILTLTLAGESVTLTAGEGVLLLQRLLAGISSTETAGEGVLTPRRMLGGISTTETIGEGVLTPQRMLAGISTTETDGEGSLVLTLSLGGTSVTVTGGEGLLNRILALAGISTTETAGEGLLQIIRTLAGISDTVTGGEGTLLLTLSLAGESTTETAGQGSLILTLSLSGQSTTVTAGEGNLVAILALAGVSTTETAGEATALIERMLSGESVTETAGEGAALIERMLSGESVTITAGEGDLAAILTLAGISTTETAGESVILIERMLSGESVTITAGEAGLLIDRMLSGTSATVTGGAGNLVLVLDLRGTSATVTDGEGTPIILRMLSGESATITAGEAALNLVLALAGISTTETTGEGLLNLILALAGESITLTAGEGNLVLTLVLSGTSTTETAGEGAALIERMLSGESVTITAGEATALIERMLSGTSTTETAGVGVLLVILGPGIPTIIFTVRAEAGFTVARESTTFTVPTEALLLRRR